MNIFHWLVIGFWIAWLLYWLVSALRVKKDAKRKSWWRGDWAQMTIIILVVLVLEHWVAVILPGRIENLFIQGIGMAIVFLGLGFTIWARIHLGSNWSNQPTLKKEHELVTSGPYRLVRHPIYTGILAAMLGTILVSSSASAWIINFIIFAILFACRIPIEERIMMQQFPNQYPDYKKQIKTLVPFIW